MDGRPTVIIYRATNRENGKCYVGMTVQPLVRRKAAHRNTASKHLTPFACAIAKYGWDAFDWDVLETAESHAGLQQAEREWIARANSIAPNGYNITRGGEGQLGVSRPQSMREKISKTLTGRPHSAERVHAIREAMRGVDYFRLSKKNSTSGVTGVSFNAQRGKWDAYITPGRLKKNLGRYADFFEAVCARKSAEARL